MLLMASGGLGLAAVARGYPDSFLWRTIGYHVEHAGWRGCTLWDLIQPAFMFAVGVALPWSVANRRARGEPDGRLIRHALWRSLWLVLLAVFLTSAWGRHTDWLFTNVLAQIGLGYPVLFCVALLPPRAAWITVAVTLAGTWLAFMLYPAPPGTAGPAAHWTKDANIAAAFDRWFLNLFPRPEPYTATSGGYQTLNFVPSIATMTAGLIAGRLLRSDLPSGRKLKRLLAAGAACLAAGALLDLSGLCPMVKRLWSPSFAIFSTGWVCLGLAAFHFLIDRRPGPPPRWTLPVILAGLNPIALYVLWQLSGGFIRQQVRIHFGQDIFGSLGPEWTTFLERGIVLVVLWLVLWWMWRRRIFVRL